MGDKHWYDDVSVLFREDNLLHFFPASNSTEAEQFNAITRFLLYSGVVIMIYQSGNSQASHGGTFGVIAGLLTLLYVIFKNRGSRGDNKPKFSFSPNGSGTETRYKSHARPDESGPSCRRPTSNNPFMNVMFSDYTKDPNRPAACDITDEAVGADADAKWRSGLYQNFSDVYNRQVNSRQFYTTPNTKIPNDQAEFASWLYKPKTTCKESGLQCYR